MIRVAGVVLPSKKHIKIALLSVFGIGLTRSLQICKQINLDPTTKVSELTEEAIKLIQQAVASFQVEGDLRRKISMDIKRLKDIKCYRGLRHRRRLPVRGQRTKTNARTAKGRKKGSKKGETK
jgi:small subunit ribosomal protein S13